MTVPRLHAVTDDAVLGDGEFGDRATALLTAHGPNVALHLRSPANRVHRLLELAERLRGPAERAGAVLVVNGRPDVALAAGVDAVQLGARTLDIPAVRGLMGSDALIGYSAHDAGEAASAMEGGADFVLLGTIWETASHPGRSGSGLERVRDAVARTHGPVVAIGGVTPERAREAVAAGAWGAAAIRGIWGAGDPVEGAARYMREMGVETG